MATLDIRPHSRRGSILAVAVMALISAGAFAEGLGRQMATQHAVAPFPPSQPPDPYAHMAQAAPTPELPVAPRHVRHVAAPDAAAESVDAAAVADEAAAAPPVLRVPDPAPTPTSTSEKAAPTTEDDAPRA